MWQVLKKQVQAICTKADKSRIISHADADISFYADADIFSHADADVFSHADADAECLCLGISESVPNAERASSRGELYEGQGSAEQCQEYLSVNSGRQTM